MFYGVGVYFVVNVLYLFGYCGGDFRGYKYMFLV